MKRKLIGTTEAARILGISRIAVFKKIQKGQLEAIKIGRSYVIDRRHLDDIPVRSGASRLEAREALEGNAVKAPLSRPAAKGVKAKKDVEDAVGKAMREFGDALRKMGIE